MTEIITNGLLNNQKPMDGASNPWECHDYEHVIEYTNGEYFLSHIKWRLEGDVPIGLNIDINTGVISGNIATFNNQTSCVDRNIEESLLLDGSNHMNNGRFKHDSYIFNFKVIREYTETDETEEPIIELISESDISIKVIKNNDIDNLIFCIKYLEAGHSINVDGNKYKIDEIDELIKVHKGPFGNCKG